MQRIVRLAVTAAVEAVAVGLTGAGEQRGDSAEQAERGFDRAAIIEIRDVEKAAHWLSRIASNTAIDFLRRNGKVNFCEIDSLIQPLSEPSESPEQAVLRSEHRAYLEQGLSVLTERERTALLLRDVEGLPAEEVAQQMQCSKATVRSHIANARIKFRRYVERNRRTAGRKQL